MKKISYAGILRFGPCYDPIKHMPKDWRGSILDLLNIESVPFKDILWLISKDYELIDDGILRRFACWCAAESLFLSEQTDKRSWGCVEVAIKYSHGVACKEELGTASSAAWSAARPR